MNLLATMSGFKVHSAYGDMLLNTSVHDEDAARMVLVLERT